MALAAFEDPPFATDRVHLWFSFESGDPIGYAPYYIQRPLEALGGEQTNILMVPVLEIRSFQFPRD